MEKTRETITFNLHLRTDKLTKDLTKLFTKVWFISVGVYLALLVLILLRPELWVLLLVTVALAAAGTWIVYSMIHRYVEYLTVPQIVEIEMLDGWSVDDVRDFNRNELVTNEA